MSKKKVLLGGESGGKYLNAKDAKEQRSKGRKGKGRIEGVKVDDGRWSIF